MDVQAKLAEIRHLVEQARSMPMSASAVVNRGELLGALDELRDAMATAFSESDRVVRDREATLEDARRDAAHILSDARNERDRIVSDTEVFRLATREAEELTAKARAEADELRAETDDYVDGKLANFEITLERTIEAVKRGRERLADRSDFEFLSDAEASSIKLPQHLED